MIESVSRYLVWHAQELAREIDARALVIYADAIQGDGGLRELLQSVNFPTILVTRSTDASMLPGFESRTWVTVPSVHMTRAGQVKAAVLVCLARGVLRRGDRVVCVTGVDGTRSVDTLFVLNLGTEFELFSLVNTVALGEDARPEVFERVLTISTQLAVEGREGRPVGSLFVLGDSERVLVQSRSLVLNPFHGYPEEERNILSADLEETIKEFAALDGAFVVRGDGVVMTAGTRLMPNPPYSRLPGGLGTRHAAAADITASTDAVAVCISQSTGTVSIFKGGQLVADIQRPVSSGRITM